MSYLIVIKSEIPYQSASNLIWGEKSISISYIKQLYIFFKIQNYFMKDKAHVLNALMNLFFLYKI